MAKKITDAVEIIRREIIGEDKERLSNLEQERFNAEVACRVYNARKRAGLNQKQLAKRIGTTQSVISRLEDADYGGPTVSMLKRIADALELELDISFVDGKPEISSDESTETNDKELEEVIVSCPAKEMCNRDWVPTWQTLEELRDSCKEFLGPRPMLAPARFRISKPEKTDQVSLTCWLTKLEIEAERIDVPKFTATRVKKELPGLVHLSRRTDGPIKAVEWLEDRGVRCVFIKHLGKTYLDGATMLLDDAKPAIGLTLRHNRLDNFWFTLLHEIGHVLRHKKELLSHPIVDEEIQEPSTERHEVQADRFANNAWVDSRVWVDFRRRNRDYPRLQDIANFAADLQVTPALVAGRLRHELRRWTHYKRFLEQGKVSKQIKKRYPIF